MIISHIAIWTQNIETLKEFYIKYFNASVGNKYINKSKGFESYFLSFDSGAKMEIMSSSKLHIDKAEGIHFGLTHFAFSVGSESEVERITNLIRNDDYTVLSEPRYTGDGYYESKVADPDGNEIEITI